MSDALQIGQTVTWAHQMRGGYGYVEYIIAKVRAIGAKRVKIEVPLRTGGTKSVWVSPSRLSGWPTTA